jgi:hypothetical protein
MICSTVADNVALVFSAIGPLGLPTYMTPKLCTQIALWRCSELPLPQSFLVFA